MLYLLYLFPIKQTTVSILVYWEFDQNSSPKQPDNMLYLTRSEFSRNRELESAGEGSDTRSWPNPFAGSDQQMVIYGNHNCTDIMTSPLIIGRRPETSCPGSVRALKTLAWRQANWAAALHLCQWTMYEIGFPALPPWKVPHARDSESADLIRSKLTEMKIAIKNWTIFTILFLLGTCWF